MENLPLTVFFAVREKADFATLDRAWFSLSAEHRRVPLRGIALVSTSLEVELPRLIQIAERYRVPFQYFLLPSGNATQAYRALCECESSSFMLLDAQRVLYANATEALRRELERNDALDAAFGGIRVSRCDYSAGVTITAKYPLFADIRETSDLICSSDFLDYGAVLFSAAFFRDCREAITQKLLNLDFDGVLKLAISRGRNAWVTSPVAEVYIEHTDPKLVALADLQSRLSHQRRIIASLEFELNRLRDENFHLATQRNQLLAGAGSSVLKRWRATAGRLKSLLSG